MGAEQGTVAAVSCNDTYAFTKPVRDAIVLIAGVGVAGDVHAGVHVKHRGRVRADPDQPNFRQVHLIQQELFAEVGAKGYPVAAGNLGENVTTSGLDLLALPLGTILRFGPPTAGDRADGCDLVAGRGVEVGNVVAPSSDAGDLDRPTAHAVGESPRSVDPSGAGAGASGFGAHKRVASPSNETTAAPAPVLAAPNPLSAVLDVAGRADLDDATAASAVALAAAAARDRGDDGRPAIVLAGLRNPCAQINGFRPGLLKEVVGRGPGGDVVYKAGVMGVVLRGGAIRPGDVVTAELPPGPHRALERV